MVEIIPNDKNFDLGRLGTVHFRTFTWVSQAIAQVIHSGVEGKRICVWHIAASPAAAANENVLTILSGSLPICRDFLFGDSTSLAQLEAGSEPVLVTRLGAALKFSQPELVRGGFSIVYTIQ